MLSGVLDILGERVLYMDTDSCIFMDDGTVEYEKRDLGDRPMPAER